MPNKKPSGRGKNAPQTHVAASVGTGDSHDQVKRLLMAAVRLIEAIAGRQKSALLDEFKAELSPTFAIRGEKRLFLGKNRPETLDFKGVNFQKGL